MTTPDPEDASELFRLLMDNVREYALIVMDPDGIVTEWNAGAERILGYTAEEAVGSPCLVLFTEEDRAAGVPERELEEAARTGEAMDDRWHVRKGGERFWANGVMSALEDGDGELRGFAKVLRDKTDQKTVEDALRESEGRFRSYADTAPAILWVTGPDGQSTYVSRAWQDFTGQSEEESLGLGWTDAVHPDEREGTRAAFLAGVEGRRPFQIEHRLRRHDGVYRWALDTGRPRFGDDGVFLGFVGSVIDVDDWRRAAEARRESEARYRTLFESIDEGFCVIEMVYDDGEPVDYRFLEANPAFEGQTGLTDAVGKRMRELAPALEEHWVEAYGRVAETGRPERFSAESSALGRWFDVYAFRAGDLEERRVAILFSDVTAQREAEAALADASRRTGEVLESISDGFFALGPDWRFTYVNAEAGRLLGREPVALLGVTIWEAFPEAVGGPFEEHYRRASETGRAETFEAYFPPLAAHYAVRAFPFAGGLSVYFRDVTEDNRAVEALRESEEKFRAVAELVPDLLWRAGPTGERTWGNRQWTEYTGQTAEEAEGFGWAEAIHPADRDRAVQEAMGAGGPFRAEHRVRGADGAYRWFLVNAVPVLDDDGRVAGWFGASTDVHDERTARDTLEARVEERTAQVRDLARALTLAEQAERRRIAHLLHDDLQQRLYGLSITLGMVRRSPLDEAAVRFLGRSEETLVEATALTRTLSHELAPPILQGDDLADLLDWVVDRKRNRYGLDVDVEVRGQVSVPEEEVRVLLYQLLRELLFNVAKHAGTKRVRLLAERTEEASGAPVLQVTVEDEGAGFDVSAMDEAGASGLGLPSVRERLALVGGRLDIESALGAGTRVTLTVPLGER